jgi:hypothetical protein
MGWRGRAMPCTHFSPILVKRTSQVIGKTAHPPCRHHKLRHQEMVAMVTVCPVHLWPRGIWYWWFLFQHSGLKGWPPVCLVTSILEYSVHQYTDCSSKLEMKPMLWHSIIYLTPGARNAERLLVELHRGESVQFIDSKCHLIFYFFALSWIEVN